MEEETTVSNVSNDWICCYFIPFRGHTFMTGTKNDQLSGSFLIPSKVDTSRQISKKKLFSLRSSDLLELGSCWLERSNMKTTCLTSAVLRRIFVQLNQYECPKWAQMFQSKICKKALDQAGKHILSQSRYFNL